MFDQDKMMRKCIKVITKFAKKHKNETVYAFAIDSGLLAFNTEERFAETLKEYQTKYPDNYKNPKDIEELKYNTGDWKYSRFSILRFWNGFDGIAYDEHYEKHMYSDRKLQTKYRKAMNRLLKAIEESEVLDQLNKSADFRVFLADHVY